MVQTLGWKLFGDYALSAAGLNDEDPDAVRRDAEALVERLVADAAAAIGGGAVTQHATSVLSVNATATPE